MSDLIQPELFTTGDDTPSPVVTYQFEIENQDWIVLALLQALEYLTDADNWQLSGDASIDLATERMTDMLSSLTEVDPMPALPKRWEAFHDTSKVVAGNALVHSTQAGQRYFSFSNQSPPANGDTFTQSFWIRAGTYTLSILGFTASNLGKIDWYLDGVSQITGQDWYSATQTQGVVKTASITIADDGYHVLKGVVNGKNTSSSNYFIPLTKFSISPSSD